MALALILGVTGVMWARHPVRPLNEFDQIFYLGIADDLVDHDRFTDGFAFAKPGPDGLRPRGMRFAPLYPQLVAAAAGFDRNLRAGMACVVAGAGRDQTCPRAAPSMRWLQFGELAGFFWLIWWMAGAAAGPAIGWGALILALFTTTLLLGSVNYVMTEMTCLILVTAAIAAAIKAVRAGGRSQLAWCCVAGVLTALTALTRPAFLYLIPLAVLAVPIWGRTRALMPIAAYAGGAALTLAPWLIRNTVVFGRTALTYGYDSHTLVQRIAFDTMNRREYGLAFLCWLPDGRAFGRALGGPHLCDRFGYDEQPTSFYVLGLRHMLPQTLAASGGYEHHLSYLLHTYILRMPVKHLLVSIPLALRGAYVAHWWGFCLLIPSLAWTVAALRRRFPGAGVFLLMALPAWFMLAFNASVAVNQVRYNLMLIPLYALSGALTLRFLSRMKERCSFLKKRTKKPLPGQNHTAACVSDSCRGAGLKHVFLHTDCKYASYSTSVTRRRNSACSCRLQAENRSW